MADSYLSMEQLVHYAAQARFKGDALRNIVAIAWAESGGKINAVGDGGNSHGLLQIHLPSHRGVDGRRLLTDPLYAFQQAFRISGNGTNFNAWTTWSHRTDAGRRHNAQQFLPAAAKAVTGVEAAASQGGKVNLTPTSRAGTAQSSATTTGSGGGGGITSASSGGPALAAVTPAPADVLTPDSSPAEIEAYIKKTYPQFAPFLANEEIKNVLLRHDIEDMDDTEVEALLRQTTYWQTHGAPSRAFDFLIGTDGQAAGDLVGNVAAMLGDLFTRNGFNATEEQLGVAAKAAIRSGWIDLRGNVVNEMRLMDFVGYVLRKDNAERGDALLNPGEVKSAAEELGVIARAYFVPMTQKDLEDAALDILEGTQTKETFTSRIKALAKGRFQNDKDVVAAIDSGLSPSDYFAPVRNTVAQILELNPEAVDFNDSKYMDLIQMFDKDTGTKRSMTLGEAAQWARSQPAFAKTRAYKETSANYALDLSRFFGEAA